jgi:hypothetical protein
LANPKDSPRTPIKEQSLKLSTDKHIPHAISHQSGLVINNFFWDFGHFFVYDAETLELGLRPAGFTDIKRGHRITPEDRGR